MIYAQYFAHAGEEHAEVVTSGNNPYPTIVIVTLLTLAVMVTILWLLKRYTTWQFPSLKERKK